MAWPPSPTSTFIVNGAKTGTTTLVWGTDALYSSAIVKSATQRTMAEEIKIENGTGLTAWHILLVDGQEYEFTLVYDTATVNSQDIQVGDTVSLRDMTTASTSPSNLNFIVTSSNLSSARKQEAEFQVTAKYFSTANVPSN